MPCTGNFWLGHVKPSWWAVLPHFKHLLKLFEGAGLCEVAGLWSALFLYKFDFDIGHVHVICCYPAWVLYKISSFYIYVVAIQSSDVSVG